MSKCLYKGVDVSEHQGSIDWAAVKSNGIDFMIPRDGYGQYTEDKKFSINVSGAKSVGIYIPAIYHFSYARNVEEAVTEARFAIDACKKLGLPKSTIIFYDFEYDSKSYFDSCESKKPAKNRRALTPDLVCEFTKVFCETIEKAGYKPGVYFNQDYYINWYKNGAGLQNNWVKWLADYEGGAYIPTEFRQTSSTGHVYGISGNVDMNECYFNYKSVATETKTESPKPAKKSNEEIANEVILGKWGNGSDRRNRLTNAGYDYNAIQKIVNTVMPALNPKKQVTDEVVNAVIRGDYGNGDERKVRLESAGYVFKDVQDAVNKKLSGVNVQSTNSSKVSPAQSFDDSLSGTYLVTALALNMRYVPGLLTDSNVVKVLPKDTMVQCYGYYTQKNNSKWLLVQVGTSTGFVDYNYVKRK